MTKPKSLQLPSHFEDFIRERRYLKNVSPATERWYRESLKWLNGTPFTSEGLKELVIKMREKGLKPTAVNSRLRAINSFLKWSGRGELCVGKLKEPQEILPTLSQAQIQTLLQWKAKGWAQRRLHTLALLLLDSGLRISEALGLRRGDVDLDSLLLKVSGKGGKDRSVPISWEMRRILFKYLQTLERSEGSSLVFSTRRGGPLGRRDVLRDLKRLCTRLGFEAPRRSLHALRHTFGSGYIRRGGSQFHLMKILGHTSLQMTAKYVNLQTADLQAVHDRLSPLSPSSLSR